MSARSQPTATPSSTLAAERKRQDPVANQQENNDAGLSQVPDAEGDRSAAGPSTLHPGDHDGEGTVSAEGHGR